MAAALPLVPVGVNELNVFSRVSFCAWASDPFPLPSQGLHLGDCASCFLETRCKQLPLLKSPSLTSLSSHLHKHGRFPALSWLPQQNFTRNPHESSSPQFYAFISLLFKAKHSWFFTIVWPFPPLLHSAVSPIRAQMSSAFVHCCPSSA